MVLKYKPRKEQEDILDFVKASVNNKNKFILIDAPVGIGKSYAAMLISNYFQEKNKNNKVDIITNTKILQEQYIDDFPFINNLSGKNNYTCEGFHTSCDEGKELRDLDYSRCELCPFDTAMKNYIKGDISLTNFHLYCIFAVYRQNMFEDRKAKILIVDEAHDFDSTFCDFITLRLNENTIKGFELGINEQNECINKLSDLKESIDFYNYAKQILPMLEANIVSIRLECSGLAPNKRKSKLKKIKSIESSIDKFRNFITSYELNALNWILDVEQIQDAKKKYTNYTISPLWGSIYLNQLVQKHYDHVIFMSGTILDRELFCFLNGIDSEETAYLHLDSPFPVENRKIYYKKQGKLSYNEKQESWKKVLPFINKIINHHSNEKGIIHCNSFEFASWIERDIKDSRLLFHTTENKDEVLKKHKASKKGTVLVSPSMENGVDLKGDYSRFQVIVKVPFPSLSSNKIKKRLEDNPDWYYQKTIIDMVQSYGRSIRSYDDYAVTYILDSSFDTLIAKYKHKFPKYFTEAFK